MSLTLEQSGGKLSENDYILKYFLFVWFKTFKRSVPGGGSRINLRTLCSYFNHDFKLKQPKHTVGNNSNNNAYDDNIDDDNNSANKIILIIIILI